MASGTQGQESSQPCIGLRGGANIVIVCLPTTRVSSKPSYMSRIISKYKFIISFIHISGGLRTLLAGCGIFC